MSNVNKTVFYIGVTNNLQRRVYEHKKMMISGFSKKYKLINLMYYEEFKNVNEAIKREKQLKNWHREWKINLIKSFNYKLVDLSTN